MYNSRDVGNIVQKDIYFQQYITITDDNKMLICSTYIDIRMLFNEYLTNSTILIRYKMNMFMFMSAIWLQGAMLLV